MSPRYFVGNTISSVLGGNAVPFRPSALLAMATAWSCVNVAAPAGCGVAPMLLAAMRVRPVDSACTIASAPQTRWPCQVCVAWTIVSLRALTSEVRATRSVPALERAWATRRASGAGKGLAAMAPADSSDSAMPSTLRRGRYGQSGMRSALGFMDPDSGLASGSTCGWTKVFPAADRWNPQASNRSCRLDERNVNSRLAPHGPPASGGNFGGTERTNPRASRTGRRVLAKLVSDEWKRRVSKGLAAASLTRCPA